ncbi:MAG: translation initiation factor IF-3 [Verrucomicrobia bacterium]|nr:translation initiation factor IF-3 [Verrucomicrobiota bacterium]
MQDYRANHRIRAREVFLVDASGQKLGVVSLNDAMAAARQAGLDLVEVSGNTNPPVCKILDFGKFRYELAKRDREAKRHNLAAKVKEMKFHVNIDPHDYATKMRHAEEFLWKGMKVKVVMAFRGREMQHQDLGKSLVTSIRNDLKLVGVADAEPKLIGKNITMMLTPLPVKKRVRRWTTEEAEGADEVEVGEEEAMEAAPAKEQHPTPS